MKYGNLPSQGSADWHKGRKVCFGGAEMGSLFGENKYETKKKMMDRKINPDMDNNDCTNWGRWFEPVSKVFVQQQYGPIFEFGSIPHSYYPVAYSPDGILVQDKELVLLEIKNPIRRGIFDIPPHYMYQIKTGMCVINVKYTLFVQCRFRRCTLQSGNWTTHYDRNYHKEFKRRCPDAKPIHFGYLHWKAQVPLFDLGKVEDMTKALGKLATTTPHVILDDPRYVPTFGYVLKFKLFDINWIGIPPDHDFLRDREDELWGQQEMLYHSHTFSDMGWALADKPEIYCSYPCFKDKTLI